MTEHSTYTESICIAWWTFMLVKAHFVKAFIAPLSRRLIDELKVYDILHPSAHPLVSFSLTYNGKD